MVIIVTHTKESVGNQRNREEYYCNYEVVRSKLFCELGRQEVTLAEYYRGAIYKSIPDNLTLSLSNQVELKRASNRWPDVINPQDTITGKAVDRDKHTIMKNCEGAVCDYVIFNKNLLVLGKISYFCFKLNKFRAFETSRI